MNSDVLEKRLARLAGDGGAHFAGRQYGIEKESLRVGANGYIAQTQHPVALGSALAHPHITTDYSEALLEFITPPLDGLGQTIDFLDRIHRFVYEHLGDELLWATSMPCMVSGDKSIPIAQYGSSNIGIMKHVYRRGLGYRYGRVMQAISGVHFNFSMSAAFWPWYQEMIGDNSAYGTDFVSQAYFGLIRNFQREGWLIPYLFGTSPAVCQSFLGEQAGSFAKLGMGTRYQPYATSLRMSDIGYKNKTQAGLRISYDHLDQYVSDLTRAIETHHPPYDAIDAGGERRQLNANILQIENEFYSFIRPKQVAKSGEKPTLALKRRGVRYVEVRALDVSAFDHLGVNEPELKFVEAFLVYCLLKDSPPLSRAEQEEATRNQQLVACCGRDPARELERDTTPIALKQWSEDICSQMAPVCELLDATDSTSVIGYRDALERQREAIRDSDRLPSSRLVAELKSNRESFFELAMRKSEEHRAHFKARPLGADERAMFEEQAQVSIEKQAAIEASDTLSFERFLDQYFAQCLDSDTCDACTDDAA